jgi:hypothetical protein
LIVDVLLRIRGHIRWHVPISLHAFLYFIELFEILFWLLLASHFLFGQLLPLLNGYIVKILLIEIVVIALFRIRALLARLYVTRRNFTYSSELLLE